MKSSRRGFLQISGPALGALGLRATKARNEIISIIADPADPVASSPPCRWARTEISRALERHAIQVGEFASLQQAPRNSLCIVASTSDRDLAATTLKQAGLTLPNEPESLAFVPFADGSRRGILACGDTRGLLYALLELADRIQHSDRPIAALEQQQAIAERPFNSLRSIGRIFCSDIQDKPWFYDREMWRAYFSMLATQRFNRFSLNFGVGYDFLDSVRDAYLLFAYPFLLSVSGYKVHAVNLPDQERDHNLEMLQFISAQAVAHGIDFQLGLWTHGYHWGPASQPNYTIEGITSENHAAYSRDALTALLKACPNISGVTLRTHGESGVREGSYSFWSTIFSALTACGRKVNLDLHTKGLDQNLIDAALETGMTVTLSPKYWAEHMGLPYQQASIRELEMPLEDRKAEGFFTLSAGSRSFTRYGYADFLHEDRPYRVMFRIWPGSHRLLLWGDPSSAGLSKRRNIPERLSSSRHGASTAKRRVRSLCAFSGACGRRRQQSRSSRCGCASLCVRQFAARICRRHGDERRLAHRLSITLTCLGKPDASVLRSCRRGDPAHEWCFGGDRNAGEPADQTFLLVPAPQPITGPQILFSSWFMLERWKSGKSMNARAGHRVLFGVPIR